MLRKLQLWDLKKNDSQIQKRSSTWQRNWVIGSGCSGTGAWTDLKLNGFSVFQLVSWYQTLLGNVVPKEISPKNRFEDCFYQVVEALNKDYGLDMEAWTLGLSIIESYESYGKTWKL